LKKILLLLSTTRESPKSIATALDIASKEAAELLILFILDDEFPQSITEHLAEEGWIGGKTTEELHHAILQEYFTHGKQRISEIEQQAQEKNIPSRAICCQGKFVEVALKIIKRERVNLIIVTRRKRSNLSRFIFGSPVAELEEKAGCELMIIDE
jgi:nucleotide-binding universal stress UspA family protein